MKLNPDCIRDILFLVEKHTDLHSTIEFSCDAPTDELPYSPEEIQYHVKQCELSGFFGAQVKWTIDGTCYVPYLSPTGHKFLSDISEKTVWNKTKSVLGGIGSTSLATLQQVAAEVMSAFIQQKIGLK